MAKDRKGGADKKKDWAQRAIGFALGFFRQDAQNKVRDVIKERIGRDPQVRDVYVRYHGDKILRFLSGLKQSLPPTESEVLEWLGDLFETALVEAGNAARGGAVGEAGGIIPLPVAASPAEIGALFQQIVGLDDEEFDGERFNAVEHFTWLGGLNSNDRGFYLNTIARWPAEVRRPLIVSGDEVRMAYIRSFVPEPPPAPAAQAQTQEQTITDQSLAAGKSVAAWVMELRRRANAWDERKFGRR